MTFVAPYNLDSWIETNRDQLKPPVGNKLLFEEPGMIAQIVGGPNTRVDFHDDPCQEFFYQLKNAMILKIVDRGKIEDVIIKEGDVFMLPAQFSIRLNGHCLARLAWWLSRPGCRA